MILFVSGKPIEDFVASIELNDVAISDELNSLTLKDINKWADRSIGASYELNKEADLYHKISTQALLPSLRIIGELLVNDDGSATDLDPVSLKKFEQFDATAKQ